MFDACAIGGREIGNWWLWGERELAVLGESVIPWAVCGLISLHCICTSMANLLYYSAVEEEWGRAELLANRHRHHMVISASSPWP